MLLIRFIVYKEDKDFAISKARQEDAEFIVLRREDSYHLNKERLLSFCNVTDRGEIMFPSYDLIVYTNDETMLNFAQYDKEKHKYNVEILFEKSEDFIELSKIHPNLRYENNLTVMFQKGIFIEDYVEYKESHHAKM